MPDPPVRPVAMSLLPLTVLTLLVTAATLVSSAPMHDHLTQMEEYYGGSSETGCYYNFLHYEEGDRIMTNEPCLNCTCHNRMLMCYLRVCPFSKAIGQDCTIEKKPEQCCPVITCPEVPVHLLTSSTTAITPPAPTGSTALGLPDNYGCSINEYFYTDGAQVPGDPSKPCELCYCIRNRTACVMQECTLQVEGCRPVYQEGICCPVRYDCDYQIDVTTGLPLLETTVHTTPGLLLTTTTAGPLDCVYNGEMFGDGASIRRVDKPCEHCYCMRGEIVCAVQECGTPLEKEAKNCTPLPPEPGKCCPQQYQCDTKIVHVNDLYLRQNRKHENTENDNTTIPFEIMSQEKETTPHTHQDVSTSAPHKDVENVAVTEATVVEQEQTDQQGGDQDIESQEHLNEVDHDTQHGGGEPVLAAEEGEIEHGVDQQQVTQGVDVHSTHGITATTKEHRTTVEEVRPTESIGDVQVTESGPEGSSQSPDVSETTPGLSVTSQGSEILTDTTHDTVSGSDVSQDSEHHTEGVQEISSEEPEKLGVTTAEVSGPTTEPAQVGHQTTSPGSSTGSESTDVVPEKPADVVHFPEDVEPSVTESGEEVTTTSHIEQVPEMVTVSPVVAEGEPLETATGPSHVPSSSAGPSNVDGETLGEVDQGTTVVSEMEKPTESSVEVHPVKPEEDEQTTDTNVEEQPDEPQTSSEGTVTEVEIQEGVTGQAVEVTPSGTVDATTVKDEHEGGEINEVEKTTVTNLNEEEQSVVPGHGTVGSETTIEPQHEVSSETVGEDSTGVPIAEGQKPVEAVEHETDEQAPTDTSDVAATTTEKSQQPVEEAKPTTAGELPQQPVEGEPSSATEGSDSPVTTEQSPEHEMHHEIPSTVSRPVEAVGGGEEMHKPEDLVTTSADMETATEQILEGGLITTIKENLVASGPVADNQVVEGEPSKEPGHGETSPVTDEESHKEPTTTAGSVTQEAEHVDHTEHGETLTTPDDGDTEGQIHHVTSEINGKPTEITATSSEDMIHKPTPQAPAQEPEAVTSETTVVPSSQVLTEAPAAIPDQKPDGDNLLSGEHGSSTGGYVPQLSTGVTEQGPAGIELTTAEHGLIPGEGSCLVDGVTYWNNSAVPAAGPCHVSCRCVSSIVHCESISCPPPPAHFTSCMPIQHAQGSCCPTYTCDGDNKVTLESDSHMAGTEPPSGETKKPWDATPTEHETPKPEQVEIGTTAEPQPAQTGEQPESPAQPGGSDEHETDQNQVEESPEVPISPTETQSGATPDEETEHTNVQVPIEDKTDAPVTSDEEKPVESSEKVPEQTSEQLPENGGVVSPGETVVPTVEPVEAEQQTDRPLTPVVTGSEGAEQQPPAETVEHEVEGSGQEEHVTTDVPEDFHSTPKKPEETDQQITSSTDSHTPEDLAAPSEATLPAEPVYHENEEMVHTTPRQPTEGAQGQENVESPEHSTPSSEISEDKLTTAAESDLKPTGSTAGSGEQPTESDQQAVELGTSTEHEEHIHGGGEATSGTVEEQTERPVEHPTVPEGDKPNYPVDQTTTSSVDEGNEDVSQVTESHDVPSISNEVENKPHEEPVTSQGVDSQVSTPQEPNPTDSADEDNETQHGQTNPPESDTQQTDAPSSVVGDKQTEAPEEISEPQTVGPSEDVTEQQATVPQGETDDQQAVVAPEENEEQQTTGPLTEGETEQPSKPEDHTVGSVDELPVSSTEHEEQSSVPAESEGSPVASTESEMVQIVTTTVASSLPENSVEHGDKTEVPPSEPSVVAPGEKEPPAAVSSTEAGEDQNVPTEYPQEAAEGSTPAAVEAEGGQEVQHPPTEHEEQTSDNILESDGMLPVSPSQEEGMLPIHPEETTDIVTRPVVAEVEHSTDEPALEEVVTEVDKTPQIVSGEGEENQQAGVVPIETEGGTQPPEVQASEVEGDNEPVQVTSTEKVENAQPQEPESQTEIVIEQPGVTEESLPEEDNEIEKVTGSDETVQHATVPTVDDTSKETVESTEHEEISIVTVMPEKEHSVPPIESMLGQGEEMTSSPQAPHVTESATSSGGVTDSPQQVEDLTGVHPGDTEGHSSVAPPVEPVVHEEVTTQVAEKPSESSTEKGSAGVTQEEIRPTESDEHPTVSPVETDNQVDTQTESQQVDLSPKPEIPSQFETVSTEKPIHSDVTAPEVLTTSPQEDILPSQEPTVAEVENNQQTVHHEGEESVSHQPTLESTSEATQVTVGAEVENNQQTVHHEDEESGSHQPTSESTSEAPQETVAAEVENNQQTVHHEGEESVSYQPTSESTSEASQEPAGADVENNQQTVHHEGEEPVSHLPASESASEASSEQPINSTESSDLTTELNIGQQEEVSETNVSPDSGEKLPQEPVEEDVEKPLEIQSTPQPELPLNYSETTEKPEEDKPAPSHQTETSEEPAGVSHQPVQHETASESSTEKRPIASEPEPEEPTADLEHTPGTDTNASTIPTDHVSAGEHENEQVTEAVHTSSKATLTPGSLVTEEIDQTHLAGGDTATQPAQSTEASPTTHGDKESTFNTPAPTDEKHSTGTGHDESPVQSSSTELPHEVHQEASTESGSQSTHTVASPTQEHHTEGHGSVPGEGEGIEHVTEGTVKPANNLTTRAPVTEEHHTEDHGSVPLGEGIEQVTEGTKKPTGQFTLRPPVTEDHQEHHTEGHASVPGEGIEQVTEGTKKPTHQFTTRPPVTEDHQDHHTEGHGSVPGEGIELVTEGTKKPTHQFTTKPPVTTEDHQTSEEQFEQFPTGEGDNQAPTDEDQDDQTAFGSGTCRYGGKMYVSAQQIPRDDPCDFCFCFRSDIICLQQSCPPPIHGCHEEPIQGFCCPRYECPVSMAAALNTTTTTTTTTTALPPHFLPHVYQQGAVHRSGCQVQGHAYSVGDVVHSASGPCLQCRCGGNGQMECNPKECSPEPMLRKMIMAAASRRR